MKNIDKNNVIKHDGMIFKEYISSDKINARINDLAKELNIYYEDKEPILVGVLNGSIYFMMDIIKKLNFKYQIDFIKASSYKGTERMNLSTDLLLKEKYKYKDILIIEDIIDTGNTMNKIYKDMHECDISEFRVISLLNKQNKLRKILFTINWIGFNIIDKYVIGYGLDYNNLFRYLKDIYIEDEKK